MPINTPIILPHHANPERRRDIFHTPEDTGLDVACISRRHDAAVRRSKQDRSFRDTVAKMIEDYKE